MTRYLVNDLDLCVMRCEIKDASHEDALIVWQDAAHDTLLAGWDRYMSDLVCFGTASMIIDQDGKACFPPNPLAGERLGDPPP